MNGPWTPKCVSLLLAVVGATYSFAQPDVALTRNVTGNTSHFVECQNGVVVSVSEPASKIGLAMLKQGGNGVDAAIATAFALSVSYPLAGNIGGGGFMLVHPAPGKGEPTVFDYRETAPAGVWPDMYTREESQFTHRAVATPGTVRGLAMAHAKFGTLPWASLIQPAIELARDGFVVDKNLAQSLNVTLADAREFVEFQRVFGKPDGSLWLTGDTMKQTDLANTLSILAEQGPDAFYIGPISKEIVEEMVRGQGLIVAEDLANYRAIERKPLTTKYRGKYDIYVPPPPSSGGVCLLEELNILNTFDLKAMGRWSSETIHIMAESMRRATADRARYLGDPAFVELPSKLISPEYGQQLAQSIDRSKATHSSDLAPDVPITPEGPSTTHFSVLDKNGMGVANTYTLERRWGSRIVVSKMGFLLNNDMRAFNLFPEYTNTKGVIGTAPNTIAPGKRPLSSQTPTIVAENGRVRLITGSPGSRAIPHTVLSILVSVLDFGTPLHSAVDESRMTHEWYPDEIRFEKTELYPELVEALRRLGHRVVRFEPLPQGDAHSIWVNEQNLYTGVADQRISGSAVGY